MAGRYSLQSDDDYKRYINQLYNGSPPTMDYYSQLGASVGRSERNAELRKMQRDQRRREQTNQVKSYQQEMEEMAKNKEDKALENLLKEVSSVKPSSSRRKEEDDKNLFEKLGGWASGVADDFTKDSELSPAQAFTRGAGNLIDGLIPFGNPVKGGILKDTDIPWLEEAFQKTDNKALNVADSVNEFAGNLIPGGAAYKAAERAVEGANALTKVTNARKGFNLGKEAQKGAGGAMLWGMQDEIGKANDGKSGGIYDATGNILLETSIGAVADPALLKLFNLRPNRVRNRASVDEPVQEQVPMEQRPSDRNLINNLGEVGQYNSPSQQLRSLENITNIQRNRQQAQKINETLNERRQAFDADQMSQKEKLQAQKLQMEDDFVDNYLMQYTGDKEVADGLAKWKNVKEMRKEYTRVQRNAEKFFIPDAYKEEYGNLVPRSFLSKNSGMDIFNAAEAHGFEGTHEGALEFANYLRTLQQSKNVKRADVLPKEGIRNKAEIEKLEKIARQTFPETEEAQAIQRVIDTYESSPARFEQTDEFQSTRNIRDAYNQETNRLLDELPKRTPNSLVDLGIVRQPEAPTDVPLVDHGNRGVEQVDSILGRKDRILRQVSDDQRVVKVLEKKLNKYLPDINTKNWERNTRLIKGVGGASEEYMKRTTLPALNTFQANGGDLQQGMEYLASKQMLTIKKNNPDYKLPNNANIEQLQQTIRQYESNPAYVQLSQDIRSMLRGLLDLLEDSGYISNKLKQELTTKYPDYVPLFRQKGVETPDEMYNMLQQIRSGNVRNPIKQLEDGSDAMVKDLLDNLTAYTVEVHRTAFTNRAMQSLAQLDGVRLDGKLIAKDVTNQTNRPENTVHFKVNGEDKYYEVNHDVMMAYDDLKGVIHDNHIAQFVAGVAKFQRLNITANPIFAAKQLVRDLPQAWTVGKFSLLRDVPAAFIDMVSGGKIKNSQLENFFKHGAGHSNLVSMDRNSYYALQKAARQVKGSEGIKEATMDAMKDTIGRVIHAFRTFNEATENLPKMAQFRATARRTGDLDQAAFEARDIMDFAMNGKTVRHMNKYAAFINANIRGKERFARALKDRPLPTAAKTMFTGAIPTLAAYYAYENLTTERQKELIGNAPEWLRQTYWLVPAANGKDVLRIPKPYETAVVSSTPIEFALYRDDLVGTDIKDYMNEWLKQTFLIDFSLNPATPIFETMLNKDSFTGQEIVDPRDAQNREGDVYTPTTARLGSDLLEMIPGAENSRLTHPNTIQNLIESYAPVSSENVNDLVDRSAELMGIRDNVKPAGTSAIEHYFNPFIVDGDTQLSDHVGDIYNTQEKTQSMKKQMQDSGELFPYPNAYTAINKMKSTDQDYARQIKQIDNDPSLSREEKQRLREQLIAERNAFVEQQEQANRLAPTTENLARMEENFAGLGKEPTRTDVKQALTAKLVEQGVPEYVIEKILEKDVSDTQIALALQRLLE